MKLFIIIFSLFFLSCNSQNSKKKNNQISISKQINDTIIAIFLDDKYYLNNSYKVIYLIDDSENKTIKLINNDSVVGSILLPKTDDEVKNFSVESILKTKKGFQINVNWGGGNYFYGREFFFNYINDNFYLDSVKYKSSFENDIKTINSLKKINDSIIFNRFDIQPYIENE